jgi:hypothetical protein
MREKGEAEERAQSQAEEGPQGEAEQPQIEQEERGEGGQMTKRLGGRHLVRSVILVSTVAMMALLGISPAAQAASPAWKLLAAAGPTNLPPRQSEVQRITVEAEGGTFAIGHGTEAQVMPVVKNGRLTFTAGSSVATIGTLESGTAFEVGSRVAPAAAGVLPLDTTVLSCSSDCSSAGSTVTLSSPAIANKNNATVQIFTRQIATAASGEFLTGSEVAGVGTEYFPSGTLVSSSGPGIVTLSRPTTSEYKAGAIAVTILATTTPLAYDAPATAVQGSLEGILGSGTVAVSGGPGGSVEAPYFVDFTGTLAEQDVSELIGGSRLTGEHAAVHVFTTTPGGPGTGEITIDPTNVGGAATTGVATVQVGPLPAGVVTAGEAEGEGWVCPGASGEVTVTCSSTRPVLGLTPATNIIIPIEIMGSTGSVGSTPVTISGGGSDPAFFQVPIVVARQVASPGIAAFWAGAFDADGNEVTQAGGHPYSASQYFFLNTMRTPTGKIVPIGDAKQEVVDLPPGFVGDPLATPRCPQAVVEEESGGSPRCNPQTRVGAFLPTVNFFGLSQPGEGLPGEGFFSPVRNIQPPQGYAAEFLTQIAAPVQALLGSVRSSQDYGVRITAPSNPNVSKLYGGFAVLYGFPAGAQGRAFLRNPTECSGSSPTASITTETWQARVVSSPAVQALPLVTGCDKLEFHPAFSFSPTSTVGSSGIGATADLHLPQEGLTDPERLAPPDLKKAVVTLPAGLTLNASSANGLQACSESQMGLITTTGELPNPIRFDESAPTCPDGSKLGTVEVKTPLLEEEVGGTIYLAEQEKNPFGSLLALYLAIESPRFGLQVKLAGKVDLDPATGQLTATFDYNPQVPVEELKLNFRGGGPRSELATPEVCGHYATTGSLEPWSAPESGPPAQISESGFDVSSGCAASSSQRPFQPSFEAGTTGTQAGAYSPLVIKVARKDGEQELKSLDFTLPKGLLGKLAGIPYCPEAAIKEAESRSGAAERSSASCPAASRIGSVDTSAGVGSEPFHVGGSVYLAGPYKGAPLSSVVVTPAVAGPFDLGDVVIRAPLYVDPETAQITAKSDPIPTILKGIPLKVRSVDISLDRPNFTLDPTDCSVMSATASIAGSSAAAATPSDRFQVGGCKALKFKPKLKISLQGATKRTGLPALKAVLTYPKQGAYSNILRAQVNLPHSEFLEQDNLNQTCTKPFLLEGKCPKSTIYGKAKAWTPLLEKPVQGPVYLVGGYGYKLPALVAELNGQIRIVLKGKVDSGPNGGIRNTFEAVPDAPVSRFELKLKGGKKYGLLINSENLCKKPQRSNALFTAQNGLVDQQKPLIANQCGEKNSAGKGKNGAKPKKH